MHKTIIISCIIKDYRTKIFFFQLFSIAFFLLIYFSYACVIKQSLFLSLITTEKWKLHIEYTHFIYYVRNKSMLFYFFIYFFFLNKRCSIFVNLRISFWSWNFYHFFQQKYNCYPFGKSSLLLCGKLFDVALFDARYKIAMNTNHNYIVPQ